RRERIFSGRHSPAFTGHGRRAAKPCAREEPGGRRAGSAEPTRNTARKRGEGSWDLPPAPVLVGPPLLLLEDAAVEEAAAEEAVHAEEAVVVAAEDAAQQAAAVVVAVAVAVTLVDLVGRVVAVGHGD